MHASAVPRFVDRIADVYEANIVREGKRDDFWMLVAFIVTFLLTRAATIWVRRSEARVHGVRIRDIHVHHLVWGMAIMLVTGYLALAHGVTGPAPAALFGAGAALTLDEFALWLHLEEHVLDGEGTPLRARLIVTAAVAALLLVHIDFWSNVLRALRLICRAEAADPQSSSRRRARTSAGSIASRGAAVQRRRAVGEQPRDDDHRRAGRSAG